MLSNMTTDEFKEVDEYYKKEADRISQLKKLEEMKEKIEEE